MRTLKHKIKDFEKAVERLFSKPMEDYAEQLTLFQPLIDKIASETTLSTEEVLNTYLFTNNKSAIKINMGTGYFSRFTNEITKEKDMDEMKMAKGQGEMETNKNGVKRESNKHRGRFDLFPFEGLEELAKWYELGAEKYGDRNWEKGVDVQDCSNRMIRHAIKAANGYMDEGPFAHFAAVAWNAIACMTAIKRNPYDNNLFRDVYLKELNLPEIPNNGIFNTVPTPIPTAEDIIRDIERMSTSESPSNFDTSSPSWEHFGKPFAKVSEIDFSEFPHAITMVLLFDSQKDTADFRRYLDRLRKLKMKEKGKKK